MIVSTQRRCNQCHIDKPMDDFPANKTMPGGRAYCCRSCNNLVVRKTAYRKELREDRAGFLDRMAQLNTLMRLMVEVLGEEAENLTKAE
jgi:hypothetical protein